MGILVFNNSYYGGYTITSYSPIHGWYPQPAFSASYVWGPSFVNGYSLREALNTLWQNFSVFLVFVPLGWLKMKRPFSILTIISIFLTIAFYSFYAFAAAGINSRFLLPIFPLAAISIATGLIVVLEKIPNKFVQSILVIGSCVILFRPLPGQFSQIQLRNQTALHTVEKVEEMVSFSAPESVFLSYVYNDQLIYYGNRSVLNYRRIPPSDEERGRYLIKSIWNPAWCKRLIDCWSKMFQFTMCWTQTHHSGTHSTSSRTIMRPNCSTTTPKSMPLSMQIPGKILSNRVILSDSLNNLSRA